MADAGHIAEASGCRLVIERARLPLSAAVRELLGDEAGQAASIWPQIWAGGDDYELVFTAPVTARADVEACGIRSGVSLTCIGHVEAGAGAVMIDPSGAIVQTGAGGYSHFGDVTGPERDGHVGG